MFSSHKESYLIDGRHVTVVADFVLNKIMIFAPGTKNSEYPMDEYTNFEGCMVDFAAAKLKELRV
jgi:hypothetical protein